MEGITIIGTSHIARQSIREVKEAIEKGKPDIVALELDRQRLPALLRKDHRGPRMSDIGRVGLKGDFFALLGSWAERRLGESVGVKPGEEMKAAYRLARRKGIAVALIDQDISITLQRLSKSITWKEKFRFLGDVLKGLFGGKPEFIFDLSTVPEEEIIKKMIARIRDRYPTIYRVLIEERNQAMTRNLTRLRQENPDKRILAIVGAGHKDDLREALDKGNISITYSLPRGMSLVLE